MKERHLTLRDPSCVDDLVEVATGLGASLVGLDTMNTLAGLESENDNAEGGRFAAMLQAVANACNGAVMVVHHGSWARPDVPRGASAFYAAMSCVFGMTVEDDGVRRIRATKLNLNQTDFSRRLQVVSVPRVRPVAAGEAEAVGAMIPDVGGVPWDVELIELVAELSEVGPVATGAIVRAASERLEWAKNQVDRRLVHLVEDGRILRPKRGLYAVPSVDSIL
jgi:AAA domain